MSFVRKLFDTHIAVLRSKAEEHGIPFPDFLRRILKNEGIQKYKTLSDLLPGPHPDKLSELVGQYRERFYENVANDAIDDAKKGFKQVAGSRAGGIRRGEQLAAKSRLREAKVIETALALIQKGEPTRAKVIARIVDAPESYVKTVMAKARKEAKLKTKK